MGSVVAQWTSIHHGRSRLSVHINIGLAACASVATASPIMVCIWFVSMTVRSSAPAAYGGSEVRGHEVISLLRICQTLPRLGSFINVMEYQRSNLSSGAWMHVVSSEQQACRSHNGVVTALLYIQTPSSTTSVDLHSFPQAYDSKSAQASPYKVHPFYRCAC